jgi:hypothetical protein
MPLLPPSSDAPLHDPAGLLGRVPELADLAARVPALRKAIEGGRPFDVYRALLWTGRFGDLAPVARQLVAQRRLFLKPLNGAPGLTTVNGIGAKLYGRAEEDARDRTYVATLYFVLAFLPVFPLAAYLVRDAEGGRGWNFFAKVPLSRITHVWQRAVAAGVLCAIAVGVASAFEGYGHHTVYVANGLPRAVTPPPRSASPSGSSRSRSARAIARSKPRRSTSRGVATSSCGTSWARRRSTWRPSCTRGRKRSLATSLRRPRRSAAGRYSGARSTTPSPIRRRR